MTDELAAWLRPANAFVAYEQAALADTARRESRFPADHRHRLAPHFAALRAAAAANAAVCRQFAQGASHMLDSSAVAQLADPQFAPTALDTEKVRSTLRQLAREWSADGAAERAAAFGPILAAFAAEFPNRNAKIVVPGCGLGRLPFELANLGFHAVGNEFSVHMIYASAHILNATEACNSIKIHPYVHNYSHIRSRADQIAEVLLPDVWPNDLARGQLEMAVGDFDESFADAELVDGVATSFFLDTSDNIFATVELISRLIRPDGLWVNFGPLLWHFDSDPERGGIELCLDDLVDLINRSGFKIEQLETDIPTTYCASPSALGGFVYKCVFFVARRCDQAN